MKNRQVILLITFIGSFLYSATNEATLPDQVQEAQSLSIKQAFSSIKPEGEGFLNVFESMQKFIKEENTNKSLMSASKLFPDRISYLKALATQAEAEKYPAFAALLYNRYFEEAQILLVVTVAKSAVSEMSERTFMLVIGFCGLGVILGVAIR